MDVRNAFVAMRFHITFHRSRLWIDFPYTLCPRTCPQVSYCIFPHSHRIERVGIVLQRKGGKLILLLIEPVQPCPGRCPQFSFFVAQQVENIAVILPHGVMSQLFSVGGIPENPLRTSSYPDIALWVADDFSNPTPDGAKAICRHRTERDDSLRLPLENVYATIGAQPQTVSPLAKTRNGISKKFWRRRAFFLIKRKLDSIETIQSVVCTYPDVSFGIL